MIMNFDQVMSICRGCLAADRRMASAIFYESEFKDLTGITISPSDRLPQWLCYECVALLQKCVRFGNKVMRSHYTLCKYVLESVPFACEKDDYPHLSRSIILHLEVPGTQIEQPEDATATSAASDIDISAFTEIDSIQEQDAVVSCTSKDNITLEKRREQNHLKIVDVRRISSSCHAALETNNICLITLNHEEQSEREIDEQISPRLADTDLETVAVKNKNSSPDHDDITIEEPCIIQPNELKSKSSTSKPNREERIEQEQTACELGRTGNRAAPQSVLARDHLQEHTDISSTPREIIVEEEVKKHANSNDSANGNLCSNLKAYICDKCNECFSKKILLIAHIHSKHKANEKSYRCNVCMTCFTYKSTYNSHIRIHAEEKRYKCNVCMKCFKLIGDYKRHMRIHTGEKPYKCDVCLKCFGHTSTYNRHMRIHNGEKPYKCDVCMKCFSDNSNCKTHMRIHNGKKPYKCDVCMKCFRVKVDYIRHTRIHTGEKPYKCDVCKKAFTLKGNLISHMLIHTGEKRYKCNICMKCFTYKTAWNSHMRLHNNQGLYKCDVCRIAFTYKGNLNSHLRMHTGEKLVPDKTISKLGNCSGYRVMRAPVSKRSLRSSDGHRRV